MVIHTGIYRGQVRVHPHTNCRQPQDLPQTLFHYSVSLVAVLLMGLLLIFLGKLDDPTIRVFCFQMHNTGPSHFQSQGGQSFVRANRINYFRYIQEKRKKSSSYIYTHLSSQPTCSSPDLWQSVPSESKLYQASVPQPRTAKQTLLLPSRLLVHLV